MIRKVLVLVMMFCLLTAKHYGQVFIRDLSSEQWSFIHNPSGKNYPAKVPGTIHQDLLRHQLIPDPFYGSNEQQLKWVDSLSWIYSCNFQLSDKELIQNNISLRFNGLDTYASVYLNDSLILQTDNMFRTWEVDAKPILRKENNQIRIVFQPTLLKAQQLYRSNPIALPGEERVYVRKAQYQFGWDWAPTFVGCGIWRTVELKAWSDNAIKELKVIPELVNDERAEIHVELTLMNKSNGTKLRLILLDESNKEIVLSVFPVTDSAFSAKLEVKHPKLWWCNGLGKPERYTLKVELIEAETVIDSLVRKVGIRKIELVQDDDEFGRSFFFKLNGKPVYAKGANWVPMDAFPAAIERSRYFNLLQMATSANMNMLRVWGGGIYEDDAFYELCDSLGIMVWQDFMFACAMYPGDESFMSNVKSEVVQQLQRLHHHPSIVLWCGNNENSEGWFNWGWQKQYRYSAYDSAMVYRDYQRLFEELIPGLIKGFDERAIYHPSSPAHGWGRKESLLEGDIHYWGVWWGMEPFSKYREKTGRFVSEFGFQGMPSINSYRKFCSTEELHLSAACVKNHQKHPRGFETIEEYMKRDFPVPTEFRDYVFCSQLVQAYGMKMAIESHRLAKPRCMGTLFWQLNDCWPVASWSSIDYYGVPKSFYYQAKKSFSPVFMGLDTKGDTLLLKAVNDEAKDSKGWVLVSIGTTEGKLLLLDSVKVELNQLQSQTVYTIAMSEIKANHSLNELHMTYQFRAGEVKFRDTHYFASPKDLALQKPEIEISIIGKGQLRLRNKGTHIAGLVLEAEEVVFENNLFDLRANETINVNFSGHLKEVNSITWNCLNLLLAAD
jgi:beta-mannosidase